MPLFSSGQKLFVPDNQPDTEVSVVGSVQATNVRRWREDFAGTALSSAWQVVQQGTGQTIAVANSELTISTGTTANSQTIIRSVKSFKIPFRIFAIFRCSQRIANQEFYFEVVDFSGEHYFHLMFDNLSGLNYKFNAANSNHSIGLGNVGYLNGSATQNMCYDLQFSSNEISLYSKLVDVNVGRGANASRNRQIPDPNLDYFIQIRSKNLAASSSNTNFIFDSIVVQETEEFSAEITGGRGGGNFNEAIPVIVNSGSVVVSQTSSASIVAVVDSATFYTETTFPLAANGVVNAGARDCLVGWAGLRSAVRGTVFTDVSGTLIIEQSFNNTVWRQTHSFSITGSATVASLFDFKMHLRFYRIKYINDAAAQTVLEIYSSAFCIGA